MQFFILGPFEVREGDRPIALGGSRQRALLALLLLHRNEVVTSERIVDGLWGERPPKTAPQAVRVYVSQLRKALEPERAGGDDPEVLATRGAGYVLRVQPDELDLDRFELLAAEGRRLLAAGDAKKAAATLRDALGLWRGPSLADFAYEPFAQLEIARLDELRLAAGEDRFDAELAAGREGEIVPELEQLVAEHPLRERLRAQLMLALYRGGRQADALDVYQRGRRLLVDELGIEPGERLRRLESRILQHDPDLDQVELARTPVEAAHKRTRRLVFGAAAVGIVLLAAVTAFVVSETRGGTSALAKARAVRVTLVLPGAPFTQQPAPVDREVLAGLRAAHQDFGVQTAISYGEPGKTQSGDTAGGGLRVALERAARASALVVVGATPGLRTVAEVTKAFPKTRFVLGGASVNDPPFHANPNVTGMKFDDREDGYLAGYLAALMTKPRGAVSAVGGKKTPQVERLIAGFKTGAKRAHPSGRVLVGYTNTFVDQSACERVANDQIRSGSSVVFDVAGYCGFGALQAAGIRGVWGIGVDDDLSYLGPHILASAVKRGDRAVELAVRLFLSGTLPGGRDVHLGLGSDSIGLVGISGGVPLAARAKLEQVASALRARDQAAGR
jgi:DNA-binding SARP family transcriptional activator/basic membrane lipoprotein Med (substrate-binding protein (PBP1-ABC) superfamily)